MPTTATTHRSSRQIPPPSLAPCLGTAAPETAVLPVQIGPSVDSRAQRMAQARAELQAVPEPTYVQAIDRWLDGGAWDGQRWMFGHCRVRLVEEGDALTLDGVAIASRNPIRLHDLAPGTRTGRRLEARALAAVAVRGDAGWYDGKPQRVRPGYSHVWDGRQLVYRPE